MVAERHDGTTRTVGSLGYYNNVLAFVPDHNTNDVTSIDLDWIDACMSCDNVLMFNYMFDDDEATFALAAIH